MAQAMQVTLSIPAGDFARPWRFRPTRSKSGTSKNKRLRIYVDGYKSPAMTHDASRSPDLPAESATLSQGPSSDRPASPQPRRRAENPLALAVLALLFERPMHPYEMAATLKERRKEQSIKLRYGSLYTVIERLRADGLIEPRETVRAGRRPARTVYAITQDGLAAMRSWMRELLGAPVKEYPRFEAALSLMPVLPPDEAAELLEARAAHLDEHIGTAHAEIGEAKAMDLPELFTVETKFSLACLMTERDFVLDLAGRIRAGRLGGVDFWRGFHDREAVPEGEQSAQNRA